MSKANYDYDSSLKKQKTADNLFKKMIKCGFHHSVRVSKIRKTNANKSIICHNSVKRKSVAKKTSVKTSINTSKCYTHPTNQPKAIVKNPFRRIQKETKELKANNYISNIKNDTIIPPIDKPIINHIIVKTDTIASKGKYKTAKGFLGVSKSSTSSIHSLDNAKQIEYH